MELRSVLVIGATGILQPVAEKLAADGAGVIGVSRTGDDGTIGVDAQDAVALASALRGRTWADAIVYGRTVNAESLAFVRASTPGRCVLVRTSAHADPVLGDLIVPADTLQLGWRADPEARWHTPAEVSEAALEVLADGRPRVLGVVRPWSDRP